MPKLSPISVVLPLSIWSLWYAELQLLRHIAAGLLLCHLKRLHFKELPSPFSC